jgi:hypothetical protein
LLPFHSHCKSAFAGLLISGTLLPGVLSAGQLGVVDENTLFVQRPTIVIIPQLPVVTTPVVTTPVVTTPVVTTPVVTTPVVTTPVVTTPVVTTPVVTTPVVTTPVVTAPVVTAPVVTTPVVTTPVVTTPVVTTPVVTTPVVHNPIVKTPVVASQGFSPFITTISANSNGNPTSPSALLASLKTMDSVKMEQALAYIAKILNSPVVPQSDKAIFAAIRNTASRER